MTINDIIKSEPIYSGQYGGVTIPIEKMLKNKEKLLENLEDAYKNIRD
jgi:hypothetical protein